MDYESVCAFNQNQLWSKKQSKRQLKAGTAPKTLTQNHPLGTRRCCDVESTSLTLIQRRNNVVYTVGSNA